MAQNNESLPLPPKETTNNEFFFPIVLIVMSILTLMGNLLVIVVVFKDPRKDMRTMSNYLVVNLAVADLLTGLIGEPILASLYWIQEDEKDLLKTLRTAAAMLLTLTIAASYVTMLFLTFERYIALEMPLWREKLFSGAKVKIYTGLIWLYAFVVGLLHLFLFHEIISKPYEFHMFFFAVCEFRLAVMFGLYIRMFLIIRKFNKAILAQGVNEPLIQPGLAHITARKREHSIAKAIFLFVGVHALCYLPYIVLQTINHSFPPKDFLHKFLLAVFLLNSAFDPILYTFTMPGFRQAIKKMFTNLKMACKQTRQ